MKCFKVVRNVGGDLCSAFALGSARLYYKPQSAVKPFVGRPYVFLRQADAQLFVAKHGGSLEIWETECHNLYKELDRSGDTSDGFIEGFWNYRKYGYKPWQFLCIVPADVGVYTTDWVKLIRRVE